MLYVVEGKHCMAAAQFPVSDTEYQRRGPLFPLMLVLQYLIGEHLASGNLVNVGFCSTNSCSDVVVGVVVLGKSRGMHVPRTSC